MNSSTKIAAKGKTIDCSRVEADIFIPLCQKMPTSRLRRPKLLSNHRVMQKLFPIYRTIDAQMEISQQCEVQALKRRPKLTDEQMFRLILARQREKYQQLFAKLNIQQKVPTFEVDQFLSCQ